jgi:Ca-activated chloride channel family protein
VRIEELVNYFPYNYAGPEADDEHPFTAHVEVASAPWQAEHRLVRIALKGRNVDWKKRPPSNLVFLIDVSGSMRAQNKLPLVQASLQMLARRFDERDRIAIITYAGESRVALPSTTANNTETVLHAIKGLTAGGSTHASAGIEEAYAIARKHLIKGSTNRVILCTDGDFNVGVSNRGDLVRLITGSAQKGITLSVLGFGMGNYKDGTLEELSNKGDGNYGYIDTQREARKVFVEQVSGTLMTIAKDVKIQVEFNPTQVRAYRLLGYENRKLAAQDFNDDTKDAGEIGAGHTVTAFYEVIPMGVEYQGPGVDPLKYQKPAGPMRAKYSAELLTVKLRYKTPEIDSSVLMEIPVVDDGAIFHDASEDFRFAAGVAAFGMILRDSPYRGESSFTEVRSIAEQAQGNNMGGYRSEFLYLVDRAEMIGEERDPEPVRPMPMPEEPPHIMPMPR